MAGSASYRISSGRDMVADRTLPRQECDIDLPHTLPIRLLGILFFVVVCSEYVVPKFVSSAYR